MNKAFTWLCSRSRTPLCDRTLTSCSKRCMRLASPAKVISAKPLPSKYAASFSQARVCTGFNLFYILSHYEDEMENVRVSSVKRETKIIWSNHTEDKKLFLFPIIFRKVNVYERFQDKRPHLPQGFSTVVLSLKIFSKLYRLSTSSLSVSNSIQPLKLGRASWGGGWKTKNKDKELDNMCTVWIYIWTHDSASADAYWMCMNTPTLTMTEPIPATKAHSRLCTYFESTRVSSHVENGVVGQQVEQPLISSSRPVGFEGSFDLLRAFWRHGHVAVLEDPAFRHTERKILIHTFFPEFSPPWGKF